MASGAAMAYAGRSMGVTRFLTTLDRNGEEIISRITQEDYDERFYLDRETGKFYPSVSYVHSVGLPTEKHLIEWIASKGIEEAERIKNSAGDQGTRIHKYAEDMINNLAVPSEGLSLKEKRSLLGLMNFWNDYKPITHSMETQFISELYGVGGTVDYMGILPALHPEDEWIIDWKSSKTAVDAHKIQVACYAKCMGKKRAGLVTLGNTTKKRYTFTEVDIEKWFPYHLNAKQYFDLKFPNAKPTVETFPAEFSLSFS
jgi:hypothetical protein